MQVFLGIITGVLAIGTVAEKDKERHRTIALCFCVTVAALTLVSIL